MSGTVGLRLLHATCDHGFEAALADELVELGAHRVVAGHRGVAFEANREGLWRVTVGTRLANRILMPIAEFPAPDRRSFHAGVQRVYWHRWFSVDDTFAVDASAHRSAQDHTGFIAQVAKDAVCDRFRAEVGRRPSVDRDRPAVGINIHLDEDHCTVSLDAAGTRLHRRGWRSATGEAPLKETLAAGMLRLIGWTPELPLVDPMCGAGTFLIEAGLIARNIAPGLLRLASGPAPSRWAAPRAGEAEGFAFERWADHDPVAFGHLVTELRDAIRPGTATLAGWDIDAGALAAARTNARRAGVDVQWAIGGLEQATALAAQGVVITNPPYGQRLAADEALYRALGDVLKQQFTGWTAWVFAANEAPIKSIGLRPTRKIPLRNGPIECRLCRYALYAGTG